MGEARREPDSRGPIPPNGPDRPTPAARHGRGGRPRAQMSDDWAPRVTVMYTDDDYVHRVSDTRIGTSL